MKNNRIYLYTFHLQNTHTEKQMKNTNKTVNCNEKKPIAVNILYTHKLTKNLIYDNKCQQNKQQIRLFHFPSLSHTHAYPTKPLSCKSKEFN